MKLSRYRLFLIVILLLSCRFTGFVESKTEKLPPVRVFPTQEKQSPELSTDTPEPPTDTPEPTQSYTSPEGFVDYTDTNAGVTVSIPENWIVSGVVDGDYAIFQSYPMDKYIGGEVFQPGDTKCDLNLDLKPATPQEALDQWTAEGLSEVVSQEEVILASGLPGTRAELEGWGSSLSMFTEINDRRIVLTCYGAFEFFDEMAGSLRPSN